MLRLGEVAVITRKGGGMAAQTLRRTRAGRGISASELALLAGVREETVRAIERGHVTRPRMRTIRRVASALGVKEASIAEFASAIERAARDGAAERGDD